MFILVNTESLDELLWLLWCSIVCESSLVKCFWVFWTAQGEKIKKSVYYSVANLFSEQNQSPPLQMNFLNLLIDSNHSGKWFILIYSVAWFAWIMPLSKADNKQNESCKTANHYYLAFFFFFNMLVCLFLNHCFSHLVQHTTIVCTETLEIFTLDQTRLIKL